MAPSVIGTPSGATRAFDAGAGNQTIAVTGPTGTDRGLVVCVSGYIGGSNYPGTITYAGVNMTRIVRSAKSGGSDFAEVWYLAAPATGSNNLVIPWPIDHIGMVGYSFWQDATQDPADIIGFNSATGSGTTASTSVSSTTDEIVIGVCAFAGDGTPGLGAGQTSIYSKTVAQGEAGRASYESGTTTTTHSYTFGSSVDWAIAAISLPSPAGGTAYTRGVSSTIAHTATAARAQTAARPAASSVAHTAAAARQAAAARPASSTVAHTAAAARQLGSARTLTTTTTHTASVGRLASLSRALAATVAHSATAARAAALGRALASSVAHAAAAARSTALGRALAATVAHTAAVARVINGGTTNYARGLASSVAHSATVERAAAVARGVSSTIAHTAAVGRAAALGRALAATVAHAATAARSTALGRLLASLVTHAAAVARAIGGETLPRGEVRQLGPLVRSAAVLARRAARLELVRHQTYTGGSMRLNYSPKPSAAVLTYSADLSPGMDADETILTVDTDVTAGGVTVDATGIDGQIVTVRFSGGTVDARALVTVTAATSASQTIVFDMAFTVE